MYQKCNNKYMTPIHQNNLETELFLSQIQRCLYLKCAVSVYLIYSTQ